MSESMRAQAESLAGPHEDECAAHTVELDATCDCPWTKRVTAIEAALLKAREEVPEGCLLAIAMLEKATREQAAEIEILRLEQRRDFQRAEAAEVKVAEFEKEREHLWPSTESVAQAHERGVREGIEKVHAAALKWPGRRIYADEIRALALPQEPATEGREEGK